MALKIKQDHARFRDIVRGRIMKNLVASVVDRETQEKIDVVKQRLVKSYGYCEICSTDVLNFVASIFARGDAKD